MVVATGKSILNRIGIGKIKIYKAPTMISMKASSKIRQRSSRFEKLSEGYRSAGRSV